MSTNRTSLRSSRKEHYANLLGKKKVTIAEDEDVTDRTCDSTNEHEDDDPFDNSAGQRSISALEGFAAGIRSSQAALSSSATSNTNVSSIRRQSNGGSRRGERTVGRLSASDPGPNSRRGSESRARRESRSRRSSQQRTVPEEEEEGRDYDDDDHSEDHQSEAEDVPSTPRRRSGRASTSSRIGRRQSEQTARTPRRRPANLRASTGSSMPPDLALMSPTGDDIDTTDHGRRPSSSNTPGNRRRPRVKAHFPINTPRDRRGGSEATPRSSTRASRSSKLSSSLTSGAIPAPPLSEETADDEPKKSTARPQRQRVNVRGSVAARSRQRQAH